ncbi:uL15 family ribosomal protein [Candidatus Woesearchaeota archaeon]|nr:uL15 family ribosomal protein [Candidatus Woesearchaeota archaeon]
MKSTTPKKKNKGMRGYKSHGWGSKKKHRNSGSRGGFGMAGTGKRADTKKPTIINEYGNTYFGRRGFVVPNKGIEYKAINLRDLNILVEKKSIKGEINLMDYGYKKLLGSGVLRYPLKITVELASGNAIEKVNKAGGSVKVEEE